MLVILLSVCAAAVCGCTNYVFSQKSLMNFRLISVFVPKYTLYESVFGHLVVELIINNHRFFKLVFVLILVGEVGSKCQEGDPLSNYLAII